MVLQDVGQDGFDSYHEMAEWGLDILKVGKSLGIGSVGIWKNDKANRVAQTDSIYSAITSNGVIRSSIRTQYYGWELDDYKTDLTVDLGINAGGRETCCALSFTQQPENVCTGIVKHDSAEVVKSENADGWQYFATYGKQSISDDLLGMAVLYKTKELVQLTEDEFSHVIVLNPTAAKMKYYFLAAWEGEPEGIGTKAEFVSYLESMVDRLNSEIKVELKLN